MDKKPREYHLCNILGGHKILSFDNLILYSDIQLVHKKTRNAASSSIEELCSALL